MSDVAFTVLSAAVFSHNLARLTAIVGIPLAVIAAVLLVLVDLNIVLDRRRNLVLVVLSVVVMVLSLGLMAYRFERLRLPPPTNQTPGQQPA